jgi:transposase-like protein
MTEQSFSIIDYIKQMNLFKRNKVSLITKIYTIADYIVLSSYRKAAKKASLLMEKITKSSVHRYVKAFLNKLNPSKEKKERSMIAIDETCLKERGRKLWVWAAFDVNSKEIIYLFVSLYRNFLIVKHFVRQVLGLCSNKPTFLVDNAPWYREAFDRLGIDYTHMTFGYRNSVERLFRYIKERTKVFYNNINCKSVRSAIDNYFLFLRMFEFYYKCMR